jgi:L-iditol 2-dehydrogenase
MQALVKLDKGPGNVSLTDMPIPKPSANQVLLEVLTCGICGTDIHVRNDTFRNFPPVILGHEFVARVIEEGADVKGKTNKDTLYAVLGATTVVCGECEHCKSGYFMFCPTRRGMGHGVNGAFAPYVCARPDQLFALDEGIGEEEGAMVEPLAAAVAAAAENTNVRPGDIALVSGPGPIGLLITMVLTFHGIKTIVAGTSQDSNRLKMAKDLGACQIVDVEKEDLPGIIDLVTKGKGVDVAFEVSGAAASVGACLGALRPLGSYTQVGHFGREITVPYDHVAFKQLRIQGSVGYTHGTWKRTTRLMANGLQATRIVSHRFPLSRWEEGFNAFENKQAIKVLLYPGK